MEDDDIDDSSVVNQVHYLISKQSAVILVKADGSDGNEQIILISLLDFE